MATVDITNPTPYSPVPAEAHPSKLEAIKAKVLAKGPSVGFPSQPLLDRLPLKRLVPQDIHSLLDYSDGAVCAVAGALASSSKAFRASLGLGVAVTGVSMFTDYRLSLAKLIPIEVHEAADYAWGLTAVAAPFLLGYAKKSPWVAATHVFLGVSTIIGSLFTDYRAQRGVQWKKPVLSAGAL